jgi:hypothetical protein
MLQVQTCLGCDNFLGIIVFDKGPKLFRSTKHKMACRVALNRLGGGKDKVANVSLV